MKGQAGALSLPGVQIGNDTIQRLYDRIEFTDGPDIEAIGADDVAIRKGQTYATAAYDLKDHHLIALLEGRDGQPFKEWLKKHKKARLVARDRASVYASAINEILPDRAQVADRFHLLQNLIDRLKDIFKEEMPPEIFIRDGAVLDKAPDKIWKERTIDAAVLDQYSYDDTPPLGPDGTETEFVSTKRRLDLPHHKKTEENREKKQQLVWDIRERWKHLENKRYAIIAGEFGISTASARKYILMADEEVEGLDKIRKCRKRATQVDGYINMIYKMLRDGVGMTLSIPTPSARAIPANPML